MKTYIEITTSGRDPKDAMANLEKKLTELNLVQYREDIVVLVKDSRDYYPFNWDAQATVQVDDWDLEDDNL